MDTLIVHVLTALLYASVLFLIAGGLSLIYGVMRIVNLAHGMLYAFGAYVSAWAVGAMVSRWPIGLLYALLPLGAVAAAGLAPCSSPRSCDLSTGGPRSTSSSSPSASS